MQLQSPLFYDGILRKNAKKFFTAKEFHFLPFVIIEKITYFHALNCVLKCMLILFFTNMWWEQTLGAIDLLFINFFQSFKIFSLFNITCKDIENNYY